MAPPAVAKPAAPGSRPSTLWRKRLPALCALALGMAWAPAVLRSEDRPPITHPAERVRTVETKLDIRLHDKAAQLWLMDKESVAVTTTRLPEQIAVFRTMSPEKIYRVTLWEEVAAEFGTGDEKTQLWESRILKVEDGSELLFDASTCEVHKTAMRKELVPMAYGLRAEPDAETRATKFPHAERGAPGGCIVGARSHSHILLCPECEKAAQAQAK